MQVNLLPRPADLAIRALLATALTLGVLHTFSAAIVKPVLPVFAREIHWIAPQFTILSADIAGQGTNQMVRVRAYLSRPIEIAHRVLLPSPREGFEIDLALAGVPVYCALSLILVLAWPARGIRELTVRWGSAIALMIVLLLVDVPVAVVADLLSEVRHDVGDNSLSSWVLITRALHDGGGLLLGCCAGWGAIMLGKGSQRRADPAEHTAPVTHLLLPEQFHPAIPGAVVSVEQPPPVG